MGGYKNGKVEIFYGDNPPSNLNILWQKRIVTNGVESSELMQYNNNLAKWESLKNKTIQDQIDAKNNLNGTNYVMVYGVGTPTDNADELQAAYDEAKKMPRFIGYLNPSTPTYIYAGQTFGTYIDDFKYYKVLVDGTYMPLQMSGPIIITPEEAKSTRATVIVAPGEYNFGASAFVVNAEGIDIVSLTGNSDVIISSTEVNSEYNYTYGIKVHTEFTLIKGINCKTNTFYIESSLNNLICEYCIGGDNSFGSGFDCTVSGTFNFCTGGNESFGTYSTASGIFNYCTGGAASFGGYAIALGIFNYCTGGNESFGSTASGTFNHCTGGDNSFGGYAIALGIFNYCTGGNESFGSTASGTFNHCTGGDNSFGGYAIALGIFNYCTGGNYSFGSTASGTFNHCTGGDNSFGSNDGTINESARLYYTRITSGTFPTPVAGGRLILCIDGDNNIVTI